MGQDDGGRVAGQGQLHHLAGVDAGAVNGAPEQLLATGQAVPAVQEQAAEDLVLEVPQARDQVVSGRPRTAQDRARLEQFEVVQVGADGDYPSDLSVLVAVQPSALRAAQLARLTSYVAAGKPVRGSQSSGARWPARKVAVPEKVVVSLLRTK